MEDIRFSSKPEPVCIRLILAFSMSHTSFLAVSLEEHLEHYKFLCANCY